MLAVLLLCPGRSAAVLDIDDRGPVLNAGNFAMRVTNAGILGNAFFDRGLSFDPSFEFPKGSGHEGLSRAELWVGAVNAEGHTRVSGGPMLEWRPTLDPEDRVLTGWAGRPGSKRGADDDGDGTVDEEVFNGRDDDGDGEADEDLGFPSQQVLAAEYVDDRPEAVNYGYPTGEHHEPLGLSVHQECYAWSVPGYDGVAGVQFTITNHGQETLRQLYLGLYCDLDSRGRNEPGGHLDDRVVPTPYDLTIYEGASAFPSVPDSFVKQCYTRFAATVPVVADGVPGTDLPAIGVVPFTHTTDPLALFTNDAFGPEVALARAQAHAPGRDTTFHFTVFAQDMPPGQGGPPVVDGDRYEALAGRYPGASTRSTHDYAVLVHAGPFPMLPPGSSLQFAVGLVAASVPDSMSVAMRSAAYLFNGTRLNLLPDSNVVSTIVGETGINGHEICFEPPPGIVFNYDPNCPEKFIEDPAYQPMPGFPPTTPVEKTYRPGSCIWTDADCDACTGLDGRETVVRWLDPGAVPPAPQQRAVRGDHQVRIEWDNTPEILLGAGVTGATGFSFAGYRLYRLSDWSRQSQLPPPRQWQLLAAFGTDTLHHEIPLATIRDTTLDYDVIQYGSKHYPVGRYRVTDREVLNGFDYLYVVTTVSEKRTVSGGVTSFQRLESPLVASLDSVVVPHLTARQDVSQVWVVPNPYRAHAPWDRPPVPGDPFGRHIDFFGLPRAKSTIRIYTVAGDLVAQVDHDGTGGDGQAAWNLISRNGQDVESGIYLFTVESAVGHSTGKFVLIR